MRAVQGALIIASFFQIILGFFGFWRIFARYMMPQKVFGLFGQRYALFASLKILGFDVFYMSQISQPSCCSTSCGSHWTGALCTRIPTSTCAEDPIQTSVVRAMRRVIIDSQASKQSAKSNSVCQRMQTLLSFDISRQTSLAML